MKSVSLGYVMSYRASDNRWVVTRGSMQPGVFSGYVGVYDTTTSQWVLWSNYDQQSNPTTYGPINNVSVFTVNSGTGNGSWYIDALP